MSTHAFAEIQRRAAARLQRSSSDWDAAEPSNGVDVRAQLSANAAFKARMIAQRRAREAEAPPDTLTIAAQGVQGSAQSLPHLDVIQRAFGRHDVTGVQAFVGGTAKAASEAIGAEAYATGNSVAFRESPSLHTAAHEAAHVVQQRAGVSLPGGVGAVGDQYEQHADRVADAVVRGESAEGLLDEFAGGGASDAVQMRPMYPAGGQAPRVVRRPLGRFKYCYFNECNPKKEEGFFGTSYESPQPVSLRIQARTVAGWRAFLTQADTTATSLELLVFMAKASGLNSLPEAKDSMGVGQIAAHRHGALVGDGPAVANARAQHLAQGVNGFAAIRRPSDAEAMALMEAMLTVGGKFDLPDIESVPIDVDRCLGPVMAAFTTHYASRTLTGMTRKRGTSMGYAGREGITAFAREGAEMKDEADGESGNSTLDPVKQLIATGFGVALAGVERCLSGEEEHGDLLVADGANTIRGCLAHIMEDNRTAERIFLTTIASAMGAAAAAGALAGAILGGFAPIANELFTNSITGEAERTRRALVDGFVKQVQRERRRNKYGSRLRGVDNTFMTRMNG